MSVRRLPVDKRMVRRRRKGMQPDPDHVIALFSLAADVGEDAGGDALGRATPLYSWTSSPTSRSKKSLIRCFT